MQVAEPDGFARKKSIASIKYESILWLVAGVTALVMFDAGIYFSLLCSFFVFLAVTGYLFLQIRRRIVGVLILLIWGLFALPFIHFIPHLFYPVEYAATLWGIATNPYMLSEDVVELTAMLGATGGIGIAFSVSLFSLPMKQKTIPLAIIESRSNAAMAFPMWSLWLAIGVALSWYASPPESVFTVTEFVRRDSAANNANFSSAWMISYVALLFAFCDACFERDRKTRSLKKWLFLGAAGLVVIQLQLMRGQRESLTFVAAVCLIHFYWAASITQKAWTGIPWGKIAIGFASLHFLSFFVGVLRHVVAGRSVLDFFTLSYEFVTTANVDPWIYLHGTWTGSLLSPLSVAGDHINNLLDLKSGRTYIDLFLSIPPGIIADAVGYVRPIDSWAGPAWEMRYGIGGTHAVVVPFMNFRLAGVLIVPALWAYVLTRFERYGLQRFSVVNLALLGTLVMASPHWLWYGEKNIMNAFVIWMVMSFFYRISIGILKRSSTTADAGNSFGNRDVQR